jgi:hypothetical protein
MTNGLQAFRLNVQGLTPLSGHQSSDLTARSTRLTADHAAASGRGTAPPVWLYLLFPMLCCLWVISLPVFPSQDGPLHLYFAQIFKQLLDHRQGIYSQSFYIKHYIPPYSLYYYSLVELSRLSSMEMADKLTVCIYFIGLPLGIRALCRSVAGYSGWVPFLIFPVLLNWPLMMGFVNYSIGTAFACFALAAWCDRDSSGNKARWKFLAWLALAIVTHPLAWMFALGFAFFDTAIRFIGRDRRAGQGSDSHPEHARAARQDLIVLALGCAGYFYLHAFKNPPMPKEPVLGHFTYLQLLGIRIASFLKTRGLIVFTGMKGIPLLYRISTCTTFALGLWLSARRTWTEWRHGTWSMTATWTSFALVFMVMLPFIPDELNGSFLIGLRLVTLLYVGIVVAAAGALGAYPRLSRAAAAVACLGGILSLSLAIRFINPVANDIASLRYAPVIHSEKPGMFMRMYGAGNPPGLGYDPLANAAAHYFRINQLLMFNTSWVNLSIIPVQPKDEALQHLDQRFTVNTPYLGIPLLRDEAEAMQTLSRVGFIVTLPPVNLSAQESPFATQVGSAIPVGFASQWQCQLQRAWRICVPPESMNVR